MIKEAKNFIEGYLLFCSQQKNLNQKTIKAYRIDLRQLSEYLEQQVQCTERKEERRILEAYVAFLHQKYKAKTVKRKIASVKAFFSYLEYREIWEHSPMRGVHTKFREERALPKVIPAYVVEQLLKYMHAEGISKSQWRKTSLRDSAVLELLFATGMRVSELCGLYRDSVDLKTGVIRIRGKGSKERAIQVCNQEVLQALIDYADSFQEEIAEAGHFFVNRRGNRLSEQSVRFMIRRNARQAGITMYITPHMFRHTFATLLLEEGVDMRYIQRMLGHASITTTEIYTYVAMSKQKEILRLKHPRNKMKI